MQEKLARVNRLVAGKEDPPNEFCAYLVQQIQQASTEGDNVRKALQQHREAAGKLETRAKEIRGVINKYIKDIQQWDKPVQPEKPSEGEKKAPPTEASASEAPMN